MSAGTLLELCLSWKVEPAFPDRFERDFSSAVQKNATGEKWEGDLHYLIGPIQGLADCVPLNLEFGEFLLCFEAFPFVSATP